jgi:hypothetical protein
MAATTNMFFFLQMSGLKFVFNLDVFKYSQKRFLDISSIVTDINKSLEGANSCATVMLDIPNLIADGLTIPLLDNILFK